MTVYDDCRNGCKQTGKHTPIKIYNPAGLPAISYRVGTFSRFKADMLGSIESKKKLKYLTTREDSDLSIALLDLWAMVADILSFYQERIANEGFLRTATERGSVLELARSIGYELSPGVAARGYLAFTMDPFIVLPKNKRANTIKAGTKVQSIPAQNEKPQVFETMEEIDVSNKWNEIRPRYMENQGLGKALQKDEVIFDGTSTNLKAGDGLLFAVNKTPLAFVLAKDVKIDPEKKQTRVSFRKVHHSKTPEPGLVHYPVKDGTSVIDSETSFYEQDLEHIVKVKWTESALQVEADRKGWSVDVIEEAVNSRAKEINDNRTEESAHALRVKCGVFGNNAPLWLSLSALQRKGGKVDSIDYEYVYPIDWDDPAMCVNVNTDGNAKPTPTAPPTQKPTKFNQYADTDAHIYLENLYPNMQPGSWLVLYDSDNSFAYQILRVSEETRNGFSLTAKVTGIRLIRMPFADDETVDTIEDLKLDEFGFRKTNVYAASEKLLLADSAIEGPVEGDTILLEKMVGNLRVGMPIMVTGELYDEPKVIKKEISFIKEIHHFEPGVHLLTSLHLLKRLDYKYMRETVRINANVAEATHGESKHEAIGSGNPTQKFQKFPLRQKPLTHISAPTPSGTASTLEIFVEGVKWQEVESFKELHPVDRVFVAHRSNGGETYVLFGNGVNGRPPPAGQENITARYRVGIGSDGNLAEDQLSILMTRPLGVRGVTNPLKSTGGTDPEKLDDARTNAPRTVLTLDRIVSLEDFKNFAHGFAGIGKATSYVVTVNGTDTVVVAVASTDKGKISDPLHRDLEKAISSYKDPDTQFTLRSFIPKSFDVGARIKISNVSEFEPVRESVEKAILKSFSFCSRDFGQGVTKSEIISVIQDVEGIDGVDLEYLHEHPLPEGQTQKVEDFVYARSGPDLDTNDGVIIPSLLLVNGEGIEIMELKA